MKPTNPFEVCTPEMLPFVQEYGGKFGPLEALRGYDDFRQNLLDTVFVRRGQSYDKGSITEPIVRASHPIDIRDMVGVLETLIATDPSAAEVNRLIDTIRQQAAEADVIAFAERSAEPGQYDPKDVIIGVQQLVRGVRATVLSHPNRPYEDREYVVSWFRDSKRRTNDALASGTEIFSATFDKHGRQMHVLGDTYHGPQRTATPDDPYEGPSQGNMTPAKLVELYDRVNATGLMRSDRAFIMEVVGDENDVTRPPVVCQLRDFKSRSLANWRIGADKTERFNLPKLVFGITPEEGIAMTIQHSPDGLGADKKTPLPVMDQPWAFLRTQHQRETPLTLNTTNMKAYLGGFRLGSGMPSPAHSQERMAAVAKVSIFENVHGVAYGYPAPINDYDFSRRLVAEMDDEAPWHVANSKLDEVRRLMASYARDTVMWGSQLDDLIDRTRGKTFRVIVRCDGYTATLDPAPGQESRALLSPAGWEKKYGNRG